jgi:alkanesulfonate monooxygenase SsuD/methylene tetrahydromethanopterin reductase-like flavin-dependent oxidoreductase (luciferase family)
MGAMALGRWLGLHLKNEGGLSAHDLLSCIRLADELSFSGVTLNEDVGQDTLALLAAAAVQTSQIQLGTAISNVYFRTAMQMAMGIATVDGLSGGRAFLGLSVGHHPWNDLGHGVASEPPLPRLGEYVEFIRKALTGQPFKHDGRIFHGIDSHLELPVFRTSVPIFIGGERPGMLGLAGGLADGAIMNVTTPEYIAGFARGRLAECARAAGRDPDAVELTAIVNCCVGEDRDEALEHARSTFFQRLGGNPAKMLETRPERFHDEIREIHDLIGHGRIEQARAKLSDELVLGTVAAGTAQDVDSAIERFYAAGATRVLLAPYPRTMQAVERTLRAMAPTAAMV